VALWSGPFAGKRKFAGQLSHLGRLRSILLRCFGIIEGLIWGRYT